MQERRILIPLLVHELGLVSSWLFNLTPVNYACNTLLGTEKSVFVPSPIYERIPELVSTAWCP